MAEFFASIIDGINTFTQNYGVSIILFTLLVRFVLLPLEVKSRKGMRRMNELKPKTDELQKKYGNDKQKLQQKQAELYKKEHYNPMSSCLPMLIQLPILYIMFAGMNLASNRQVIAQMYEYLIELNPARSGAAAEFASEGFLWIKNIWMADSPFTSVVPDLTRLQTIDYKIWQSVFNALPREDANVLIDSLRTIGADLGDTMPSQMWNTLYNSLSAEQLASLTELLAQKGHVLADGQLIAELYNSLAALDSKDLIDVMTSLGAQPYATIMFDSYTDTAVIRNSICGRIGAMKVYQEQIAAGASINLLVTQLALHTHANGWFVLPVLAAATQFLVTMANPQQPQTNQTGGMGGSGKFMKYFFPIFSLFICATSNAGFALYWVTVNVLSGAQTFFINLYLDNKDKKKQLAEGGVMQ